MLLIGLGHKAQNGKDTFADAVVEHWDGRLNIRLASFADPLRAEVADLAREIWAIKMPHLPFDGKAAMFLLCLEHGVEFDPDAPVDATYPWGKQRKFYQWYGTEYRRAQNDKYWVDKGEEMIRQARRDKVDALAFRDMRFENEYDLTGDHGGWRIKVSRLGWVSNVPPHISETALEGHAFDLGLGVKDGQLALLKRLSVQMFNNILGV